jgi:hypothetical protein
MRPDTTAAQHGPRHGARGRYPRGVSIFGRKTIKAGPVRFTISRRGLSESIGTRHVRVRVSPGGRRHTTVNFGHGFRWTK